MDLVTLLLVRALRSETDFEGRLRESQWQCLSVRCLALKIWALLALEYPHFQSILENGLYSAECWKYWNFRLFEVGARLRTSCNYGLSNLHKHAINVSWGTRHLNLRKLAQVPALLHFCQIQLRIESAIWLGFISARYSGSTIIGWSRVSLHRSVRKCKSSTTAGSEKKI